MLQAAMLTRYKHLKAQAWALGYLAIINDDKYVGKIIILLAFKDNYLLKASEGVGFMWL